MFLESLSSLLNPVRQWQKALGSAVQGWVSKTCLWPAPFSVLKSHIYVCIYLAVKSLLVLLACLWWSGCCCVVDSMQDCSHLTCCCRSLLCRNNVQREQGVAVPSNCQCLGRPRRQQGLPCCRESSTASACCRHCWSHLNNHCQFAHAGISEMRRRRIWHRAVRLLA